MKAPAASFLLGLFLACLAPAVQANLLTNGGFDTPTAGLSAPNYPTTASGLYGPSYGPVAADHWFSFNNTPTTTTTELLASTDPIGGGYMIHVSTGGQYSGIGQGFSMISGATLAVDVFVLSGQAWLALYGDGGNTMLASTTSQHTRGWETLYLPLTYGNPMLFILYSAPGTGADFYADNAWADSTPRPTPEPASLALLAAAALVSKRRLIGRTKHV